MEMWPQQPKKYTCLACGVENYEPSVLCHPLDVDRIESKKLCTVESKPEPKEICRPQISEINFECDTCKTTSSNKDLLCFPRKI